MRKLKIIALTASRLSYQKAIVCFLCIFLQSCNKHSLAHSSVELLGDGIGDGYLRLTVKAEKRPEPVAYYSREHNQIEILFSAPVGIKKSNLHKLHVSVDKRSKNVYFIDINTSYKEIETSFDVYVEAKKIGRWKTNIAQ